MQLGQARASNDEEMALARFEDRCRLIFGQGASPDCRASWRTLAALGRRTPACGDNIRSACGAPFAAMVAVRDLDHWAQLWKRMDEGAPQLAPWALACLRLATLDAGTSPAMMSHVAAALARLGASSPQLLIPLHARAFAVALDRCARPRGLNEPRPSILGDVELARRRCLAVLEREDMGIPDAWAGAFHDALHPTLALLDPLLGSLIERLCLSDTARGALGPEPRRL